MTGIFLDIYFFGVLLKYRLFERGLVKVKNLGFVSSSSLKFGILNLIIFDVFLKFLNGVVILWELKGKVNNN